MRTVDHDLRDGLVDDPLHDALNEPLAGQAAGDLAVLRLDLVAQIPMREQP